MAWSLDTLSVSKLSAVLHCPAPRRLSRSTIITIVGRKLPRQVRQRTELCQEVGIGRWKTRLTDLSV